MEQVVAFAVARICETVERGQTLELVENCVQAGVLGIIALRAIAVVGFIGHYYISAVAPYN